MILKNLSILNGLAIIAVIFNHTAYWAETAMFYWTDRYKGVSIPNYDQINSISYFVTTLIHQATYFAVPAFLFVSGYFITITNRGHQSTISWKIVSTRLKSLLIPYLIWTTIIFVGDYLQGNVLTPLGYLVRIFVLGAHWGYYFVPTLCIYYLLSPILYPLAMRHWKPLLGCAILMQLLLLSIRYIKLFSLTFPGLQQMIDWTPDEFFLRWAFYFPFGMVIGIHFEKVIPKLTRYRKELITVLLITYVLFVIESQVIFRSTPGHINPYINTITFISYTISFLLLFLAYSQKVFHFSKQLHFFGSHSYGIYLMHFIFLGLAVRIIYKFAPLILAAQYLFQPILLSLGICIPVVIMIIISKSPIRRSYHFLFG